MEQEQYLGEKFQVDEIDRGEQMRDVRVDRVIDGLGFGEGNISHTERVDAVGKEHLSTVESAILSGELLVPVSQDKNGKILDDDGCGDGRKWERIFHGVVEKNKSLIRPKVFGGGPTMTVASEIGLGRTKGIGLQEVFSNGIGKLKDNLIDFGGHTDTHAHGKNCGCGAIDRAPEVVKNVAKYSKQINATIEALDVRSSITASVLDNYVEYADEIEGQDYSGSKTMGEIIDSGKIVKELSDVHLEMYIILNEVSGHTIDQEKVREISGDSMQVFVVDTWRLNDLVGRLYNDETQEIQEAALIGELAYTLGVAATLTKGDLPVYRISSQQVLANAI